MTYHDQMPFVEPDWHVVAARDFPKLADASVTVSWLRVLCSGWSGLLLVNRLLRGFCHPWPLLIKLVQNHLIGLQNSRSTIRKVWHLRPLLSVSILKPE